MTDNSVVSYNGAKNGGGVYTKRDVFIGGNISNNKAGTNGGGIYFAVANTKVLTSLNVNNNSAGSGGGIYLSNAAKDIGGKIQNNSATSSCGGVYVSSGTVKLSATISSNKVTSSSGSGAGVYVNGGTVTISGDVRSNTLTTGGNGAGVFVTSGTVTISNLSAIESNSGATKGGGLYIAGGTVTLSGSISNNNVTARSKDIESLSVVGGGVYVGNGTFRLSGGTISGNNVINNGCGDEDVYTVNFVNTNLGLPSVYQHRSYVSGVYISSQNKSKFTYSSGTINERDNRSGSIKYIAIYNAGTSSHLSLPSSPRISGDLYFAKSTDFNTILIKNGNVNADYVNYYPKNYLLYWYENHGVANNSRCTGYVYNGWGLFSGHKRKACGQTNGTFKSDTKISCNDDSEDNTGHLIKSIRTWNVTHCTYANYFWYNTKNVTHREYYVVTPSIETWVNELGSKSSR